MNMLGTNEPSFNANKAQKVMRKKIAFMIKEQAVANDFLDLVDKLKHIKSKNHGKFVKAMKDRDAAGKDLMMSNIFQNGFLLLSDEAQQKLQEDGTISKADMEWVKRAKAIQKKKDIEDMKLVRAHASVHRKERRKELQVKILSDISENQRSVYYYMKWVCAIKLNRVFRVFKTEVKRRHDEQEYLARVHWIAVKARNQMRVMIEKNGKDPEERIRRMIKNGLISFSSMTNFSMLQAGNRIVTLLRAKQTRYDLFCKMKEFHAHIRKIKERFKDHFLVKNQQIAFIHSIMLREKERIEIACLKENDPEFRKFLYTMNKLTDKSLLKIATLWYRSCSFAYEPMFFAWRNKIHEF